MNFLDFKLNTDFKVDVARSILLHVLILAFFVVKATIFPSQEILIQNSIRVDIVALPDKVEPVAPAAVETPPPKVEIPEKPAEVEKKPEKPKAKVKPKPSPKAKPDIKKNQKDALARIKALQAIENIEASEDEKTAEQNLKKKQKPREFKGNAISSGDSLTGLDQIEFNEYFSEVRKQFKDNWNLPQWLAETQLKAQVSVGIDARGYIIRREIILSSGNEIFDNSVLAAVENSSPLPVPPDRLKDIVTSNSLVFSFPER